MAPATARTAKVTKKTIKKVVRGVAPTTRVGGNSAPTPPSAAPAAFAGTVLFSDTFDDVTSGWEAGSDQGFTFGYGGGGYRFDAVRGSKNHYTVTNARMPETSNVKVDVDFTFTAGGGGFGVHCYDAAPPASSSAPLAPITQEPEHIYVGLSSANTVNIYVSKGGVRTAVGNGFRYTPVLSGANHATIECRNTAAGATEISVVINGEAAAKVTVPVMVSPGYVWPFFEAGTGLAQDGGVLIDNLVLTQR